MTNDESSQIARVLLLVLASRPDAYAIHNVFERVARAMMGGTTPTTDQADDQPVSLDTTGYMGEEDEEFGSYAEPLVAHDDTIDDQPADPEPVTQRDDLVLMIDCLTSLLGQMQVCSPSSMLVATAIGNLAEALARTPGDLVTD